MRILAVDDESDTRRLLKDLLRKAGHQVLATSSAIKALIHLRIQQFDLLLLDLMMPGIDGEHLAQILSTRRDTFELPIVVASCRKAEEEKSWPSLQRCVHFLEKPFSPAALLDAVNRVRLGEVGKARRMNPSLPGNFPRKARKTPQYGEPERRGRRAT